MMLTALKTSQFGTCSKCELRDDLFSLEDDNHRDMVCADCLPWCQECDIRLALSEEHDNCDICEEALQEEEANV